MISISAYHAAIRNRLFVWVSSKFGFKNLWLARLMAQKDGEQRSFGLNGLDLLLHDSIDTAPGYYIEIGANDGVRQSNTLLLEVFFGWKGLLIEPARAPFEELQRNRSAKRNFLLRAACVSSDYEDKTATLIFSNLMSIVENLDSDLPDPKAHAKRGERFLSPGVKSLPEVVPAMTMSQALELANAPTHISLLSLDVEGSELEVLRGIDFQTYRFDSILVESREVERIERFLKPRGYSLQRKLSIHDYLFQPR